MYGGTHDEMCDGTGKDGCLDSPRAHRPVHASHRRGSSWRARVKLAIASEVRQALEARIPEWQWKDAGSGTVEATRVVRGSAGVAGLRAA